MKVVVIGAGISGITAAYFLAKAGYTVTILYNTSDPSQITSYANGGQISASNTETWHNWQHILKALQWIGKKNSPLSINMSHSWQKISWFGHFIAEMQHRDSNTETACRWAIAARKLYRDIASSEGITFDKVETGIMHLYHTPQEIAQARKSNQLYKRAGLQRYEISKNEIFAKEPAIDKNTPIVGGFYCAEDFTGDIYQFCHNLSGILKTQYGVRFELMTVNDLNKEYQKRQCPIVVCAGVHSQALAKSINERLFIYPVKGYSITLHDPGIAPWVSLLDDEAKIVVSRLGTTRLRVAGFAEFSGYDLDIPTARITQLQKWITTLCPGINIRQSDSWAGLRPMTPSMMPIVRQSYTSSDIWYHTGHGHLGWTLSAATAQQLAMQMSHYYGS